MSKMNGNANYIICMHILWMPIVNLSELLPTGPSNIPEVQVYACLQVSNCCKHYKYMR